MVILDLNVLYFLTLQITQKIKKLCLIELCRFNMQEINFHPLYTSLVHVDEIDTVIHVDCSFVNKRKTWSKNNIGCPEDS